MNPSEDILARLKATTKINGAYPRDIEDAIKEIENLRQECTFWFNKVISYELSLPDQKTT